MVVRQEWMVVVAGEELVDALTAERQARVPRTGTGYDSEALCKLQQAEARRSVLGAEIVRSNYGYSVRYDSGLQDWGLLASSKSRQLDGSLEHAERWAREWVAQDPTRRYAWRRKEG